jgi:hypothetical protein
MPASPRKTSDRLSPWRMARSRSSNSAHCSPGRAGQHATPVPKQGSPSAGFATCYARPAATTTSAVRPRSPQAEIGTFHGATSVRGATAPWPRVPRVHPLRFRYAAAHALDRDDFRTVEQLIAAALRTLTGWLAINRHPTSERLAKAVAYDDACRASPIALRGTFSQALPPTVIY